jgi:hypothetical protein
MNEPKAVYGKDGRLLGITYDDGEVFKRVNTNPEDGPLQVDWDDFLHDIASILITRIPRDTESEQAKALIEEDNERLLQEYREK